MFVYHVIISICLRTYTYKRNRLSIDKLIVKFVLEIWRVKHTKENVKTNY